MSSVSVKHEARQRRAVRTRKGIAKAQSGRPRLSVFRSEKQIYAQVIDDARGVSLAAASWVESDLTA